MSEIGISRFSLACMASVAMLLVHAPVSAQNFDTLFTSSEERAYLDYLREDFLATSQENGFDIDEVDIPEIPEDGDTETEEVVVEFYLGGVISRLDGGRTVWLNGKPVLEQDLMNGVSIRDIGGVAGLQLALVQGTFLIKPGQSVNVETGEMWDAFETRPTVTDLESLALEDVIEEVAEEVAEEVEESDSAGPADVEAVLEVLQVFQDDQASE